MSLPLEIGLAQPSPRHLSARAEPSQIHFQWVFPGNSLETETIIRHSSHPQPGLARGLSQAPAEVPSFCVL